MKIAPPQSPVVAATTPKTNEPVKPTVTTPTSPSASYQAAAAPPKTELEGASRGYVSPTAVECPFHGEEKVQVAKKIPCPALAGMFNAGMLKVEKDGTVKIPDLERALSQLGPDAATRAVLTRGADATDDVKGSFNLFKLNGSNLDHTGSSGIRQNGVYPERFELLMKFSKDGDRLTAKDLADAADHFAKEDPGFKGRVTQLAEMSIVLKVFGRHGADGERYFTRDDARQLFVEGKIPSSWEPPAVPNKVRIHEVLGGTALGLFRQLINRE